MAQKRVHLTTNFTSGELSPWLIGRTELAQRDSGVELFYNFICTPQGGATRRTGTKYIGEVKDSSKEVRLIPFKYSQDTAYILEFGDQYIRFYQDEGVILDSGSPYEISSPYEPEHLAQLHFAQANDVMYIVHPLFNIRRLVRNNSTSWSLDAIALTDGPYYDLTDLEYGGTGTGITIGLSGTGATATATASDDLFVSTDVGRSLRWYDGTSYTWYTITGYTSATEVTVTLQGSTPGGTTATNKWRLGIFSATTGYPSSVTFHEQRLVFGGVADTPQTFMASQSADIENFSPDDEDNDDLQTANSGIVATLASTEDNAISFLISSQNLFIGTASDIFTAQASTRSDAMSPDNVVPRPATGFGATTYSEAKGEHSIQPIKSENVVLFVDYHRTKLRELLYRFEEDGYRATNLSILAPHLFNGDRIKYITRQQEPFNIIWVVMESGKLLGLTYERAEKVLGWHQHDLGGTFNLGSAQVESITTIPGSQQSDVYMVVKRTINGGTKRYIEKLIEQVNDTQVKEDMVYLDSSLTLDDSMDIEGITIDGSDIININVTGHGLTTGDKIWLKNNTSSIESDSTYTSINRKWTVTVTDVDNFTLDNSDNLSVDTLIENGTIAKLITTISGLDHLEGETVDIFADGAVQAARTVSSGSITLQYEAAKVHVGLGYTSKCRLFPAELGTNAGSIQGVIQRVTSCLLRVYRSLGGNIAFSETSTTELIKTRFGFSPMDTAPDLFTGIKEIQFPHGYDLESRVYIEQTQPLPLNILLVIQKILVSDE